MDTISSTPQRLRDLADWFDEHPAATASPFSVHAGRILHHHATRVELIATARAIGGDWAHDKSDHNWFRLTQPVSGGFTYELFARTEDVFPGTPAPTDDVLREIAA